MAALASVPATGLPIGTLLTYNLTIDPAAFQTSLSFSPFEDLIAAITSDLANTWDLVVTSSNVPSSVFGQPIAQLVLQMRGPNTYGSPDDVRSIVDGEIIQQTGGKNYIVSSNISSFTLPPAMPGAASQTGQTGAAAVDTSQINPTLGSTIAGITQPIADAVGNTVKTAASSSGITDLLKGVQSTVLVVVLVVIVGIILLVAYKPDSVGRVARGFV